MTQEALQPEAQYHKLGFLHIPTDMKGLKEISLGKNSNDSLNRFIASGMLANLHFLIPQEPDPNLLLSFNSEEVTLGILAAAVTAIPQGVIGILRFLKEEKMEEAKREELRKAKDVLAERLTPFVENILLTPTLGEAIRGKTLYSNDNYSVTPDSNIFKLDLYVERQEGVNHKVYLEIFERTEEEGFDLHRVDFIYDTNKSLRRFNLRFAPGLVRDLSERVTIVTQTAEALEKIAGQSAGH